MSTIFAMFALIVFYYSTQALCIIGGTLFLYVWKPDQMKPILKWVGGVIGIFFAYLILIRDILPWIERTTG